MTVHECIDEFKTTSDKIRELEKYNNALKEKLIGYMRDKDQDVIRNGNYEVRLAQQKRDQVTRKRLPPELWEKYRETITFPRLTVKRRNDAN